MLNKNNFEIARLCPKKNTLRYALHGIRVTPTGTVVTDGHVTLQVSGVRYAEEFDPFILHAKVARKIADALSTGSMVPELNEADIEHTEGESAVRISVRNQDADLDVYSARSVNGKFPNADKVIPAKKGATGDVLLDLDILVPLLERIRKFHGNQNRTGPRIRRFATFRFYKTTEGASVNENAQRIDAKNNLDQTLTAVIMPCRPVSDS